MGLGKNRLWLGICCPVLGSLLLSACQLIYDAPSRAPDDDAAAGDAAQEDGASADGPEGACAPGPLPGWLTDCGILEGACAFHANNEINHRSCDEVCAALQLDCAQAKRGDRGTCEPGNVQFCDERLPALVCWCRE